MTDDRPRMGERPDRLEIFSACPIGQVERARVAVAVSCRLNGHERAILSGDLQGESGVRLA
jgi:hypothetical protein